MQKIIRLKEVMAATGFCRAALYQKMKDGEFPRPIPISDRARGWLECEVVEWQKARIAKRSAGKMAA